jgi:hypothetical protein
MSNYKLAILEPYLPLKHGILDKKHHHLYGHYLILDSIPLTQFYEKINVINKDVKNIGKNYSNYLDKLESEMNIKEVHPFIRNYKDIMRTPSQLTVQIIKPSIISIGENEWDKYSVGVNKTHWLRVIQRRWREIHRKRIQSRMNINNLKYREIYGKWPSECNIKFTLGI